MFSGCGTTGYVERVRLEARRLWRKPLRPARRETMEAWTRGVRSGRKRPSLGGRGEETACWVVGEARDGTPTCHRALLYTGPGRRPGRGRTGRMGRAQVVRRPPRGPRGRLFCSSSSNGVTAWLRVTACRLHTVPAHLEGFPRDWAPPLSSQPPVPPCSAFPGGRGRRSLGQPRGPRGGWPGAWVVALQQARLRGLPPRSPHSPVVWSSGGERGRWG